MSADRIVFYASALSRCNCGKPATYEIRASGNVVYDRVCDRHVNSRIRQLAKDNNGVASALPNAPTKVRIRGVLGGPR